MFISCQDHWYVHFIYRLILRGIRGLTASFTEMSFSPILHILLMLILYAINNFNVGHVTCCHGNGGHLGSQILDEGTLCARFHEKYFSFIER